MKIAFVFFSGTGNTKRCIEKMEECLSASGEEAVLFDLEQNRDPDLSLFDVLVLGYPIHAFNAPKLILDFARNLETLRKENPIYVLKTSGEGLSLNEESSAKLFSILRKKGYSLAGEFHYLMPYDMVFRHTEKMAYWMWRTALRLISLDARRILKKERFYRKTFFLLRFPLFLLRIEQKASPLLGKTFRADKKCIRCGLCVRSCPTKNIVMDEKGIHFENRCILCSRCAFFCPKDVIHLGILDFMKVNGPYRFEPTEGTEKERRTLRRSYRRYFERAEKRIKEEKLSREKT